jgi:Secretion system C-terminal sorting domain
MSGRNIFAGTDSGSVFISTNNGNNWANVSKGLEDAGVNALTVLGPYLFAGTENAGVWRRPLSDFGISAVSPVASTENSLSSYPNPFSQSTTISFTSPESGVATVAIVNILGATVARIFSGELDAGTHAFTWDAHGLAPGVYECLVHINGRMERTAMVVN